jgi:hypothetical protein
MNLRLYGDIVAPADRTGSSRTSEPSVPVSELVPVSRPVDTERLLVQASAGNVSCGRERAWAEGGEARVGGGGNPADEASPAETIAVAYGNVPLGRVNSQVMPGSTARQGTVRMTLGRGGGMGWGPDRSDCRMRRTEPSESVATMALKSAWRIAGGSH